jgi:hypothetical protein
MMGVRSLVCGGVIGALLVNLELPIVEIDAAAVD